MIEPALLVPAEAHHEVPADGHSVVMVAAHMHGCERGNEDDKGETGKTEREREREFVE